jgi:hypothetical protein
LPAAFLKVRTRSLPAKILDRIKNGHIEPQGCESAKQNIEGSMGVSRYYSGPVAEKTTLQAVHISLWTRLATGKEEVIKVAAGLDRALDKRP